VIRLDTLRACTSTITSSPPTAPARPGPARRISTAQ